MGEREGSDQGCDGRERGVIKGVMLRERERGAIKGVMGRERGE